MFHRGARLVDLAVALSHTALPSVALLHANNSLHDGIVYPGNWCWPMETKGLPFWRLVGFFGMFFALVHRKSAGIQQN